MMLKYEVVVLLLAWMTLAVHAGSFNKNCYGSGGDSDNDDLDLFVAMGVRGQRSFHMPWGLQQFSAVPAGVLAFVKNMVESANFGRTRMALIGYNLNVVPLTQFTSRKSVLNTAMYRWMPASIGASHYRAIEYMRESFRQFGRPNAHKVIVIITDQVSDQFLLTSSEAKAARAEGIIFVPVGFGNTFLQPAELVDMASNPYLVTTVSSDAYVGHITDSTIYKICYILHYFHNRRTPTPQPTPATTPGAEQTTEVVILADDSESRRVFDNLAYQFNPNDLQWLSNTMSNFDTDRCQLGLILFSRTARVLSGLTNNSTDLMNAVDSINNMTAEFATTDTALGLQAARNLLTSQGDPVSEKVIVLLTDGLPNDVTAAVNEATLAKDADIQIRVVAIPQFSNILGYSQSTLTAIASSSSDVTIVNDITQLPSLPSVCPM